MVHVCLQSSWNSLPKHFHAGGSQSQRQIDWHGAAPHRILSAWGTDLPGQDRFSPDNLVAKEYTNLLSFGDSILSFCYFWCQSQAGSFTHSSCSAADGTVHPADQRLGRCSCGPVWWDLDTEDLTWLLQMEITPKAIWLMFKGGQGNYWSVCVPIYSTCGNSHDVCLPAPVVSWGLGETLWHIASTCYRSWNCLLLMLSDVFCSWWVL